MSTAKETRINNISYVYLNINGVVTAIPKDEMTEDLLDELFDR